MKTIFKLFPATAATAAVQLALTFLVITGVYGFFHHVMEMSRVESGSLALIMQAAVWTRPDSSGRPACSSGSPP